MTEFVFSTERLQVRQWRPEDVAQVLAVYSHPDVTRWVDDGLPLPPEDAQRWMVVTQTNYNTRGYGMFAIEDCNTGETIGFGGLVHPGGQPDAEVKYAFLPKMWGQGIATEFVQALITYAWSVHALPRIISTIDPENLASARVLVKAGLHRIGDRTEEDGSVTDIYAIDAPHV